MKTNETKRTEPGVSESSPAQASLGRVHQALIQAQKEAFNLEIEIAKSVQFTTIKTSAENIQRLSEIRAGITRLLTLIALLETV